MLPCDRLGTQGKRAVSSGHVVMWQDRVTREDRRSSGHVAMWQDMATRKERSVIRSCGHVTGERFKSVTSNWRSSNTERGSGNSQAALVTDVRKCCSNLGNGGGSMNNSCSESRNIVTYWVNEDKRKCGDDDARTDGRKEGQTPPPHATITKDRKNGESQSHRGVFKQNTVEMTEEKKLRKIHNKL